MSNVVYSFDGNVGYGKLPNGMVFRFDRDAFHKISNVKWPFPVRLDTENERNLSIS